MILQNKDRIAILISFFLIIIVILIWSISHLSSTQPESLDNEIFEISWSDEDDDDEDDDEDDDDEDENNDGDDDNESDKESKKQSSTSFNNPMIRFLLYLLISLYPRLWLFRYLQKNYSAFQKFLHLPHKIYHNPTL